jgi:hypothetical protein
MEIVDPRVDPALVPEGSRAVVIAEHQEEYRDLPSIRTPPVFDGVGRLLQPPYVITRWTLSDEERAAIVRGEDVYITLLSAGPINPLFATVGPVNWRSEARI